MALTHEQAHKLQEERDSSRIEGLQGDNQKLVT
jgi:hypothetical protein